MGRNNSRGFDIFEPAQAESPFLLPHSSPVPSDFFASTPLLNAPKAMGDDAAPHINISFLPCALSLGEPALPQAPRAALAIAPKATVGAF